MQGLIHPRCVQDFSHQFVLLQNTSTTTKGGCMKITRITGLGNQAQVIRQVSWTCTNSGFTWMSDDDLHSQISVQLWIITEMIKSLSPECTRRAKGKVHDQSGKWMTLILRQLPFCGPRMAKLWCPVFCLETKKATQDCKKSISYCDAIWYHVLM